MNHDDATTGAHGETPEARRRRHVLLSAVLTVVVLAAGFGGFEVLSLLREAPERTAAAPVRTAVHALSAERAAHTETLGGYGRARALRRAAVPAEIAATVLWVSPRLEAGRVVEQDEELVRLDARDAESAAREAAARLAQAEARERRAQSDAASLAAQIQVATRELEASQRELARISGLIEQDASSESEVDAQRVAVAIREQALLGLKGRLATTDADAHTAQAEIEAAEATLARAQYDVTRASVRAPYAGTIVRRTAQRGERVAPGAELFTIVDLARVEVPVTLPASRHADVRPGAAAALRLREGGDVVWHGAVSRVSPDVDADRRVFEAYLDVVAEGGGEAPIAPGAFVVADVTGRTTPDVIAVPREAFVGDVLFVAQADGDPDPETGARPAVVHERRPEIARRLPETMLVSGGVEPGELIVVTGVSEIAEGSRVLVLPERGAAAPEAER